MEACREENEPFAEITQTVNDRGWNELMLIIHYRPDALAAYADMLHRNISVWGTNRLQQVLQQHTVDGWNALMLALRQSDPAIVVILLDLVDLLDDEAKTEIFLQHNTDKWNCLLFAIHRQPSYIPLICHSIAKMKSHDRMAEILLHQTSDKWHVLNTAAYYASDAVTPLCQLLSKLPQHYQFAILEKRTLGGNNALMHAIQYQATCISPLWVTMQRLGNTDYLAHMLTAASFEKLTVLMHAAKKNREITRIILEEMLTWPQAHIAKLFFQVSRVSYPNDNINGWSVLMYISRYQPVLIDLCAELIGKLSDTSVKQQLWTKQNDAGENVLMLIITHHPAYIEPMLQAMEALSEDGWRLMLQPLETQHWKMLMTHRPFSFNLLHCIELALEGGSAADKTMLRRMCKDSSMKQYLLENRHNNEFKTTLYETIAKAASVEIIPNSFISLTKPLLFDYVLEQHRDRLTHVASAVDTNSVIGQFFNRHTGWLSFSNETNTMRQLRSVAEETHYKNLP